MLNDVLFEIGVEELPSKAVSTLGDALAQRLHEGLEKAQIAFGHIRAFATPRRLAVLISAVHEHPTATRIVRRGPAVANTIDQNGQPSPALLGFAKSCGVRIEALTKLTSKEGQWWLYEADAVVTPTRELLPGLLSEAIRLLPITKLMRWGNSNIEFVRPVHWILLLWGHDVIDTTLLGVKTGRQTYGHRFHHPKAIDIAHPSAYESALRDAHVVADFQQRRQMMCEAVLSLSMQRGLTAVMPQELVDEVTSIVEWPHPMMVPFDPKFLTIPAEVLIEAMQVHQKCFALRDAQGELQPYFVTVANIESRDPPQVMRGNAQVMKARLSDAAFFYQQDQSQSLSDYFPETAKVMFQAGLGSLADQAHRMQALIEHLVEPLSLHKTCARRAAELSQCDLMTGMVGEFPALQGIMGYYYALNSHEDAAVALALKEYYYPRFSADELPQSTLGVALSLVSRLDTLVGGFSIGKKPTGVKDPFKLRRHALALVRLLSHTPCDLRLSSLLQAAGTIYGERCPDPDRITQELKPFIWERALSYFQSQNISMDVVGAVRAVEDECFWDIRRRIDAVNQAKESTELSSLVATSKRIAHLLQNKTIGLEVDPALLIERVERELFELVRSVRTSLDGFEVQADYGLQLQSLFRVPAAVDQFFEQVMVMVEQEELRNNRLSLLRCVQTLLQHVADLSLLNVSV